MCRLFGLNTGTEPISATFWLLNAPDSLAAQSRRNPDGAGIGCYQPDGLIVLDKQPLAAYADQEFATASRDLHGMTFVAHVRYASSGGHTVANTHPFEQDGRLFAHNGVVGGLDVLDRRLAELAADGLVGGQTDSERIFALVTAETRRLDGDLGAGLVSAIQWIGRNCQVYAVNLVLATAGELWVLRYPDTHELYVLERPAGGSEPRARTGLNASTHRISAKAAALAERSSVIVASERMDDDAGWRLLQPGELLHVGRDLTCRSHSPFDPPAQQLRLTDLEPAAAASQHPTYRPGAAH
jgi:predicted glutamine amidotransferase